MHCQYEQPDRVLYRHVVHQWVAIFKSTNNYYDNCFVDKFGGGSPDWARGVANVTYSYLIELRDRGFYGFLLPEDQILATGEEVWEGVRVILNQVRHDRYGSGQEFNDTYYDFLQEEDFLFRLTKTFPAKWQGVYDYAGWSLAHSSTPVANCCCLYVLLLSLISSLHASLSLALFAN